MEIINPATNKPFGEFDFLAWETATALNITATIPGIKAQTPITGITAIINAINEITKPAIPSPCPAPDDLLSSIMKNVRLLKYQIYKNDENFTTSAAWLEFRNDLK